MHCSRSGLHIAGIKSLSLSSNVKGIFYQVCAEACGGPSGMESRLEELSNSTSGIDSRSNELKQIAIRTHVNIAYIFDCVFFIGKSYIDICLLL